MEFNPLGKDAKPSPARQFGPGTSGGRWQHRLPFCFWGMRNARPAAGGGASPTIRQAELFSVPHPGDRRVGLPPAIQPGPEDRATRRLRQVATKTLAPDILWRQTRPMPLVNRGR